MHGQSSRPAAVETRCLHAASGIRNRTVTSDLLFLRLDMHIQVGNHPGSPSWSRLACFTCVRFEKYRKQFPWAVRLAFCFRFGFRPAATAN